MSFQDGFENLLSSLNSIKTDVEVETATIDFCASAGFNVRVNRMPKEHVVTTGDRHFVITFESETLAIRFANCVHRPTWGFCGLLVEA